jgi:hypothetical protein
MKKLPLVEKVRVPGTGASAGRQPFPAEEHGNKYIQHDAGFYFILSGGSRLRYNGNP